MRTTEGEVSFVSNKTKGIKFKGKDDVWYNPVKDIMNDFDSSFVGKYLILEMVGTDGNLFSGYKLGEGKETEEVSRETKIVRQNALTQANEFVRTLQVAGQLEDCDIKVMKEIMFNFAKECEDWVNR